MSVLTIDGHAGAGKTSVGKRVAKLLRWRHISSGDVYRARAAAMAYRIEGGADFLDAVAVDSATRAHVKRMLRSYVGSCLRSGVARGFVVDGRDCGSVVFPRAEAKVWLSASEGERARRKGLSDERLTERDAVDERCDAHAAPDALLIDTTHLTEGETVQQVLRHALRALTLALLLALSACTVLRPPVDPGPAVPPSDYTTPGGLRLWLRGNCLFLADAIGGYLDAAQASLESVPGLQPRRTRVVVYPWGGLWERGSRVSAGYSPHEVRVEWHPSHGARGYAEARVRQAGVGEAGIRSLAEALAKARAAGEAGARR